MPMLTDATDEEIQAECQARIDRGDRSPNVYLSTQQSDVNAQLDFIRNIIVRERCANPHDPALARIGLAMDMIESVKHNPLDPIRIAKINTTLYGKDDIYGNNLPDQG